ncbi:MAG: TetR/AcrR family transcriptional regulator [Thermodesulfobacteriota bacterium]
MSFYKTSTKNRRDRILHAALKLFHTKGYFKTSVHDIREQADVSIGLVYRYFKNKEEIALTVYTEITNDMLAVIDTIIAEHTSAHDRCKAVIAYYFELTEQYPELVDFVIFARRQEITPDMPICGGSVLMHIREKIVQVGIANGEIRRMHTAVTGPSIFGGMVRLIQLRLAGLVQVPLPTLLDDAWESAWRAVKP